MTFAASFSGAQVVVDGKTLTTPVTVSWIPGTQHTIDLPTPQDVGTTSWIFSGWSNGGGGNGISQTIVAPQMPLTLTAGFVPQYELTTSIHSNLGGEGGAITVSPASWNGYYFPTQSVTLTATPDSGCTFLNFSGGISSTNPVSLVSMAQAQAVTANFACTNPATVPVTVQTSFAGGAVIVDGNAAGSPAKFNWVPGSVHTLNLNTPQDIGTTSWIFSGWSDGGGGNAKSHSIVAPDTAGTWTASFVPQYELITSVSPANGGTITVNPISWNGYYFPTQTVQITASANPNCSFVQFNGDATGTNPTASVLMAAARSVSAVFSCYSPATPADSFVDALGVNVHLHYTNTPYALNFPMIQQALQQLGARHIRDGLIDTTWQPYYDHLNQLGAAGIKADLVTTVGQSASLLTSYPSRVATAFESYEAPNEWNASGDANWVSDLQGFQQFLYGSVKSNASTAMYPVIGPSLTNAEAFTSLGNLSSFMDAGNLHNYFGGRNPGTPGWGANGYGSIPYNLALAATVDGKKPIITTETGYFTVPSLNQGVPEAQEGRYIPRVLLNQLANGIKRTYLYELLDEGTDATNAQNFYGLIHNDGSPKPAFTALTNLNQLLQDPGPNFPLTGLSYSLAGQTGNLSQAVFEKRDGTLYLLLWLEVPSFDVTVQQVIPVPSQTVTLTVNQPTGTPSIATLDDTGAMTKAPLTLVNNQLTVSVTDRISVLIFPPSQK